ncbi:MAG: hypothetical protein AB7S26_04625 [Sandaracinaceae bacterium]
MAASPARPSIRWTLASSIGVLSLAGGALATVAVVPLFQSRASPDWFGPEIADLEAVRADLVSVALCTIGLLAIALTRSLRSRDPVGPTVLFCLLLAWVDVPASLLGSAALRGELAAEWTVLARETFIGSFAALPLGVFYGAVAAIATVQLRLLVDRPSFALRADAQRVVGGVTLGSAVFALVVRAAGWGTVVPGFVPMTVAVLGAAMYLEAEWRAWRLRALAEDPAAHGYVRVPLETLGIDRDALWPLHRGVASDASHVLVRRTADVGQDGYRRTAVRVPIALVD